MSSWKKIGSYSRGKNNEIVRATTSNITKNIIFQPNNLPPKETGVSFSDNTFQYTAAYNLWMQGDPSTNIFYDKGCVSVNTDKQQINSKFSFNYDISNTNLDFGNIIALNHNGNSFVCSYQDSDENNNGKVATYLFNEDTKKYELAGEPLDNPETTPSTSFGYSISINLDETRLVIGDPYYNNGNNSIGKVYQYVKNEKYNGIDDQDYWTWSENDLAMSGDDIPTSSFGSKVSISSNKNNYVISVSDVENGNVFVYVNNELIYNYNSPYGNYVQNKETSYNTEVYYFRGGETAAQSKFGFDNNIVYVNENLIRLLISAPYRNVTINDSTTLNDSGEVTYVCFTRTNINEEWQIQSININPDQPYANALFGYSLDWFDVLYPYFIVGSPGAKSSDQEINENINTSYSYIFKVNGDNTINQETFIPQSQSNFGYSLNTNKVIEIDENKNEIEKINFAVGQPTKNDNGMVYYYNYDVNTSNVELLQTIPGFINDISFGKCVSVSDSFKGSNKNSLLLTGYNNYVKNSEGDIINETGNIGIYEGYSKYIFNVLGNSLFDGNVDIVNNLSVNNSIISDNIISSTIKSNNLEGSVHILGHLNVEGNLIGQTKQVYLDNPVQPQTKLIHHSIESPQMDLLYSGQINLIQGKATIDIDNLFSMRKGTFFSLNNNIRVFTSNESGWDPVKGFIKNEFLEIISKNKESNDLISFLLIGQRKDKYALDYFKNKKGKYLTEISN